MQLEILILSEVSQKEKDTRGYYLRVQSKIWHKWTYLQNRNRLWDIGIRLGCQTGRGSEVAWEFGVSRCKLLHLEWISNEVPLYSTGNHIQSLMMEHDGKYYEKKNVCIYIYTHVTGSLCYIAEISTKIKNNKNLKK